jgi:hypothetical protein
LAAIKRPIDIGSFVEIFEIWQALHGTGRAEEHQNGRISTLTIVFKITSPAGKLTVLFRNAD